MDRLFPQNLLSIRLSSLLCVRYALFAGLLLLSGCAGEKPSSTPKASPPSPTAASVPNTPSANPTGPLFRETGREAGLNYEWKIPGKRPLNILQTIGNGCAFVDTDQDSNLDILLVGPKLGLFKGDGQGHFTDVTQTTGLSSLSGHFLGCTVGDYDNDGYPDLYISGWRTGLLLHNESGKRFRDVTKEMGLQPQPWGSSCGFADLDKDGYLDLYIANYVSFDPKKDLLLCPFQGILTGCGPNDYDPMFGVLYHNEKGKQFRDVTRQWGLTTHGKSLGVAFGDFMVSGEVGIALANDLMAGDLFENRGRQKFTNIASTSGTAFDAEGEKHAGMGVDWADYDNDGRLDLFVTTFGGEVKTLYRNSGGGQFAITSTNTGLKEPTLPYVAWGCKFFDADNNGWLDLMITNGHVQDNIARFEKATYRQPTLFLHNRGGKNTAFEDATRSAGIGRLPKIVGRGLAVGDYDNDGRVDVLVVDSEGRPLLLHNETMMPTDGWVGFRLIGNSDNNRDAYGAVLTVRGHSQRWMRQCQPCGSYLSSSDPRVHFGLGSEKLESVTIRWPDGTAQTWKDLAGGRYYTVRQGQKPE